MWRLTFPAAPVIEAIELPTLKDIVLPDFEFQRLRISMAKQPTIDGIEAPEVFMDWQEPEYESELLGEITSAVTAMMANGLPEPVLDAIYLKSRERITRETERSVQEAADTWARRF